MCYSTSQSNLILVPKADSQEDLDKKYGNFVYLFLLFLVVFYDLLV